MDQPTQHLQIEGFFTGTPQSVQFRNETVQTAIFKSPVREAIRLKTLGFETDKVADLRFHGGEEKAVYAYRAEHYDWWRTTLNRPDISFGMFGENLTISGGLEEEETHLGDIFQIGDAQIMAVQARIPCFKLGIRFNDQGILKTFLEAGRFGVYFKVVQEGLVAPNSKVTRVHKENSISIRTLGLLYTKQLKDKVLLERALAHPHLPQNHREGFVQLLSSY